MKIRISTYTAGQQLPAFHFFILNKGLNSGKPAIDPWCNCFLAEFQTMEDQEYFFWLSYGIWITGKFRYFLHGSVVPFIRKDELIQVLDLADAAIHDRRELYQQTVLMLHDAEQNTQRLTCNLRKLQQAKVALLQHFIRI